MFSYFRGIVLALCSCLWVNVQAAPIQLISSEGVIDPSRSVEILVDADGRLDFNQIKSSTYNTKFKLAPQDENQLNFGFSKATYWIKITLQREENISQKWVLEVPFNSLDKITLYLPDGQSFETGLSQLASSKPLLSRFYAFPINIETFPQTYYLKIKSSYAVTVPLKLAPESGFYYGEQVYTLIQALYFGGLIALGIYNLLIFLSLRDSIYLYYSCFAALIGLGIFSGNGFARTFFWQDFNNWDQISQSFFYAIAAFIGITFSRKFLETTSRSQAIDRSLLFLSICFLATASLMLFTPWGIFDLTVIYIILFSLVFPMLALLTLAAFQAISCGQNSARYFLIAWSCVWLGAFLASLRAFNLIPTNSLTSYALQIGSAFQMLLLSFALAGRINEERKMREYAQRQATSYEEVSLQTLRDSEARLERLVKERTSYLQVLLENEKNVRSQYVRFGAMISHEFRNPLGILETQLELLKREIQQGINQFEKRYKTMISATQRLAILFERWMQSDRLNNMMEVIQPVEIEINSWLADIIKKYRNYQSNHKFYFKRLPNDILVSLDDQLIQTAILNIIDNACKYSPIGSLVKIQIVSSDNHVGVAIVDQGIGIDPGHHDAIFKEYFRVNENSPIRGIGLGLAFVKKIAELHHGKIEVSSRIGEGTRMVLWLPISSPNLMMQADPR